MFTHRLHQFVRAGLVEMRLERGHVAPLLVEEQPQRILAIDLHRMQQASILSRERWTWARLAPRSASKLSSRAVTLPVTMIILSSPSGVGTTDTPVAIDTHNRKGRRLARDCRAHP